MCSCVQNNLIGNYWFWWIYFSWITQPSSVCDSYTALKRPSDMYIYMYWMCLWYLDWLVQFSSAGLNGGLYKNNGIARPQHRELYSLLFVRSMWSAVQRRGRGERPTTYYSYPRSLINRIFLCLTVKLGQIWDTDTHICNSRIKITKFE